MLQPTTLQFLKNLQENNNRDWFHEHKKPYQAAKKDFKDFIQTLILEIGKFDTNIKLVLPKQCTFRINRDVRFSKNKAPYKNNFGAFIAKGGKKSGNAGYYLHIEPDNHMVAGGIYMPMPPQLKRIRQEIDYNTTDFRAIIESASFVNHFGQLDGPKLKTAPRGYPKDHPAIDLLRFKSFTVAKKITDKQVTQPDFLATTIDIFKAMYNFNQFLNRTHEVEELL